MRESLATSVNAKNLEWDEHERQVDRVAAMSAGTHLGSYLIRVREGAQTEFAHRAMLIIAKRIIKRYRLNRGIAEAVATQSIMEWVGPHCRCCGGTRERMMEDVKVSCHVCNGSGVHRFSDSERKKSIGAWGGRIEDGLNFALAEITTAAAQMANGARVKLGRESY